METTFERRLADLGWQGVPLPTVMVEMCSLFVSAGLDAQAVRRRIEGAGADGSSPMADSRCVVGAFLDQADREGRIEALARPGSRDLPEALAALERLRGDGHEPQVD